MNIKPVIAAISSVALLAGCTQQTSGDQTQSNAANSSASAARVSEASSPLPDQLANGTKIAIVQQSGQGDYFQQFLNGTKQQSSTLKMDLSIFDAQGDNAKQASQLDQAISSGVQGIIVRHGFADSICPGVNRAIEKGITVVVYDVEVSECAPKAIQAQQSDSVMAQLVLEQMTKDIGTGVDVGYVNVEGIAPLDRRDRVWREYVQQNQWTQKFKTGNYTASSATDSAPMVDNALKSNNSVVGVYALYDEFTKATLTALEQNPGLAGKVSVYGADISTADIELMTKENSPWKATGATDPNAIGAAVVRALALQMVGELNENQVEFPPILITQDYLRENQISNMEQLREKTPELNLSDELSADWIPVISF